MRLRRSITAWFTRILRRLCGAVYVRSRLWLAWEIDMGTWCLIFLRCGWLLGWRRAELTLVAILLLLLMGARVLRSGMGELVGTSG